jgi:GTP-binding protein HflX
MGMIETKKIKPSGVLVAVADKQEAPARVNEFLEELAFLASTLNIRVVDRFAQRLDHPDPRSYVGKGKLEEIKAFVQMEKVETVIFDDDLSPSQLRNLEKELKAKVYDRSLLILDIFLKRAKTAQAKTQVELARYQYLLPRLTRMWTHLERQRGGTATRGGAGEKEIETDRRNIRNQIAILRKRLDKMEQQAITRRKSRDGIVRVALVGYTNAGKSTLMQKLSKEDVYARDELFATLDSTVRKVVYQNIPFLLSDTVGFIRKLPHDLVASFRSTLAEVNEADILLHVVDYSNTAFPDHMEVVSETLSEIGAHEIPVITVFNKIDRLQAEEEREIPGIQGNGPIIHMSAHDKDDVIRLRDLLIREVAKVHYKMYPHYLNDQVF